MHSDDNDGFWKVALSDVLLNGERLQVCTTQCYAILDTGTSLIGMPKAMATKVLQQINLSPNCSNVDMLPYLNFQMGTVSYRLAPEDYVMQTDGVEEMVPKKGFLDERPNSKKEYVMRTSKRCAVAITEMLMPDGLENTVVLGDPFIRKYYTVFSRKTKEVGFATAKHSEPKKLLKESF